MVPTAIEAGRADADSESAALIVAGQGGAIGSLIGDGSAAEVWFKGIAAGTFLLLATLGIVREEFFTGGAKRPARPAAATAGAGIMAVVAIGM